MSQSGGPSGMSQSLTVREPLWNVSNGPSESQPGSPSEVSQSRGT